ncbi:proline-rich protein 12-like [Anarrhichthys ocellatus]|uniref:proline-rich protein 12-like n=1 Tax=Anarrhichthys ocellatus TaxID=433405 RepID=UPI0012EEAD42|nr:proline-rich protein 12-like [Anarrhichthys ocellatus]
MSDVIVEAEDSAARREAQAETPARQPLPLPCLAAFAPAAEDQCPSGLLQPPAPDFPSPVPHPALPPLVPPTVPRCLPAGPQHHHQACLLRNTATFPRLLSLQHRLREVASMGPKLLPLPPTPPNLQRPDHDHPAPRLLDPRHPPVVYLT